ncbi:MAG: ATP-binding protein, partial [Blastocatellia bacterium]|nr:ATP-binding protein [Blastocatellia bacterium]
SDNGDISAGEAPATFIEYAIRDTGVGIGPDILDKIFDPFFSTKTHGTGLGLASVQKIIEAHHGQISVESQPNQGTTFTIRLRQEP